MDDATQKAIADEISNQLKTAPKTLHITSYTDAAWGVFCVYVGVSVVKYGWSTIKATLG